MRLSRLPWSVALIAAVAALAVSCGGHTPLDAQSNQLLDADYLGSAVLGTLVACTPIPGDSTTQVIGPEGGTIRVGPHKLRVPEGALSEPVTITAVTPSDTVNRVVFTPEGLTFQRPAWLTLSYANCGVVRWVLPKRIAYTTDLLAIITLLASLDNPLARRVSADVDHFSTYAVAW